MTRRALITGASGTVGVALQSHLQRNGCHVETWDRRRVPIDHYGRMEAFVQACAPDVVFHLAVASQPTGRDNESWLVNYEWSSELAWICRVLGVRMVFTSTALVFTNAAVGPFTLEAEPDATEGYGHDKRAAEGRVAYQNPEACIVRLGWQIAEAATGNNMVAHLHRTMAEHGVVRASTRWIPACSFVADTAAALVALGADPEARGVYMADANAASAWSFYDIACALNVARRAPWRVEPTEDYVYDQRMVDPRVRIPPLAARLEPRRSA